MAKKIINELKKYTPKFSPGYVQIQADTLEEWGKIWIEQLKQHNIEMKKTLQEMKKIIADSNKNEIT